MPLVRICVVAFADTFTAAGRHPAGTLSANGETTALSKYPVTWSAVAFGTHETRTPRPSGRALEMTGGCGTTLYSYWSSRLSGVVPTGVVTVTSTVPFAPCGTTAVMEPSVLNANFVSTEPKCTDVAP